MRFASRLALLIVLMAPPTHAGNLIYVSDSGNNRIEAFNDSGALVTTIGGGLTAPGGMAFGPNGDLIVANTRATTVTRFAASSGYSASTTIDDGFGNPQDVAFAANGDLFVSYLDQVHNSRYVRDYSSASGYKSSLVIPITGTFPAIPTALKIAPNGDLFVEDDGNNVVDRFSASSGFKAMTVLSEPGMKSLRGMAFGPGGDLFVSSFSFNAFFRFSAASDYTSATTTLTGLPQRGPGLTFGPEGDLYLTNPISGRVSRYTASSGYTAFTNLTQGLSSPVDVAIGPAPSAAPEPSTIGLGLIGAIAAGFLARRGRP